MVRAGFYATQMAKAPIERYKDDWLASMADLLDLKEGKMMKNASVLMVLSIILCALVFWLSGCGYFARPGETAAEGHRRHLRNLSINQQNLVYDIDRAILADEPSMATSRRTE